MDSHVSCQVEFVSSQGDVHCKGCVPSEHRLIKVEHILAHPEDETKCLVHLASPIMGYLEKYPGLLMFEDAKNIKELPKSGDRICLNKGVVQGVMAHHLIGAKRKKAGANATQADPDKEEEGEDNREMGDKSRVKPDPFEMLSDELMLSIFANLDQKSAANAASSSKRFRDLANDRAIYQKLARLPREQVDLIALAKRAYIHGSFGLLVLTLSQGEALRVTDIFKDMPPEFLGSYDNFVAMMNSPLQNGTLYANVSSEYIGPGDLITIVKPLDLYHPQLTENTLFEWFNDVASDYVSPYLERASRGSWNLVENDGEEVDEFVICDISLKAMEKDNQELFEYVLRYFMSRSETNDRTSGLYRFFRGMLPHYLHRYAAIRCFNKMMEMQFVVVPNWTSSLAITATVEPPASQQEARNRLAIIQTLVSRGFVDLKDPCNLLVDFATIPLSDDFSFNVSGCLPTALMSGNFDLFSWLALKPDTLFDDTSISKDFYSPLLLYLVMSIIDKHLLDHQVLGQQGSYGLDLLTAKRALSVILPNKEKLKTIAIENTLRSSVFRTFIETLEIKIRRASTEDNPAAAAAIYQDVVAPLKTRVTWLDDIDQDFLLSSMLDSLIP